MKIKIIALFTSFAFISVDVDKSRVEESDCCDGDNWNFESIFK